MMLTDEAIEYLHRVKARHGEVGRWLTLICPECEQVPGPPHDDEHVVDEHGHVLIACEGYWVVNPNVLGMTREQWMDWCERAETERRMDEAIREGLGLPADAPNDVVHDAVEDAMRDVDEPDDDGE